MKIIGLLVSILGLILSYLDSLFKHFLHLNTRQIQGPLVIDENTQRKVNKYKSFKLIHDKFHLLIWGIALTLIGIFILAFHK